MKVRKLFIQFATVGLSAACLCGIFSSSVFAQAGSRTDRDIEFVSRLAGSYIDLAEDFLTRLEKSPNLKDEDKARINLVRADIFSRKAAFEPDLNKKIEMLQQSVATIEDFLKNYPNHPSTTIARARIGDLSREFGEAIVDAIQLESDSKKIEELRTRGEKYFKEAEERFRKQIDKGPDDKIIAAGEIDLVYVGAKFNYPKTQFRHALLYEQKHAQRSFLLKEALKNIDTALFEEGNETYGGTYDGMITRGLILKETGDWAKAKESFEGAIKIKDLYQDEQGKYVWDDVAPAIIASAVYYICKGGNDLQDYASVIDVSDRCLKLLPDIKFYEPGWKIMLERAKALGATGQSEEAQKLAQQVLAQDPRGYYGKIARDLFSNLLGNAENISPGQLINGARAEMQKGNLQKAIQYLRQSIRRAGTKPEQQKTVAEAYMLMAQYFDSSKRDDESILAYLQVPAYDKDPASKLAPSALFSAASGLVELAGSSGSIFYEGMSQKAVKLLAEKYGNSDEAKRAKEFSAKKLEAKKQWEEAAKIYLSVTPDAKNYPDAQNRAAYCYYMLAQDFKRQAKPDLAKANFEKSVQIYQQSREFILKKIKETTDEQAQVDLKNFAFGITSKIVEIYLEDSINKPEDALKLLAGAEKEYADKEIQARARNLRMRTLIELKRLDEATTELDKVLAAAAPDQRGLSASCRRLAAMLEKDVEEREKKDKRDPKILVALRKAADYYTQWIERGKTTRELRGTGAEDMITAGDRLVAIGGKISGVGDGMIQVIDIEVKDVRKNIGEFKKYWKSAADLYEAALKPGMKESLGTTVWTVRVKLGRCLGVLENWDRLIQEYKTLVEAENFVNSLNGQINVAVANQKPELLDAYAGMGYAHYASGLKSRNAESFKTAVDIFAKIQENTKEDTRLWWAARYYAVSALYEAGDYQSAKQVIDSISRNFANWDDGKFGYGRKFDVLKSSLDMRAK